MTDSRRLDKNAMRQRGRELRALLNEWDPIGVMGDEAPPGDTEYDDLLWPLMRLLESAASESDIGIWLARKLEADYGFTPEPGKLSVFASRVKGWYEQSWAGSRA
jgi:hypothetical protein